MKLGALKAIVIFFSIIQWLGYLATLICVFIELRDDRYLLLEAYILTCNFLALLLFPYFMCMFSKNRLHYNLTLIGLLFFAMFSFAASFSASWLAFGDYTYDYWVCSIQNFVSVFINFLLFTLLYLYRDDIVVVKLVPTVNNLTTTSLPHVRDGHHNNITNDIAHHELNNNTIMV